MRACKRAAHGAALLLVLSTGAGACPTSETLAEGITFIAEDGSLERHVDLGEDIIALDRLDGLGRATDVRARAVHGLFPLRTDAQGIEIRYDWLAGLEALPYPQLGLDADLALVAEQGGFEFPAIFSVSVGDVPGAVRLGDCTLEMWGIVTEMFISDDTSLATVTHWFPALGTGLAVREDVNGAVTERSALTGMQW